DVALLDEVQELQPAVRVLLGDGDDEAQVRLDHLGLGFRRFTLAGLHRGDYAAEFGDGQPGPLCDLGNVCAQAGDLLTLLRREVAPGLAEPRNIYRPVGIELLPIVVLQEAFPRYTVPFSQAQELALEAH